VVDCELDVVFHWQRNRGGAPGVRLNGGRGERRLPWYQGVVEDPVRAKTPVLPLPVRTRPAVPADLDAVTALSGALWPERPVGEHREHAAAILSGAPPSTLPLTLIVAEVEGHVAGFIEVGLRSHADGCDTRYPVGFVEGWYVQSRYQRRSVGRALMTAAEDWSRAQGAREIASDTWIDEEPSQHAHQALGFEVVDRCVHFRKLLTSVDAGRVPQQAAENREGGPPSREGAK